MYKVSDLHSVQYKGSDLNSLQGHYLHSVQYKGSNMQCTGAVTCTVSNIREIVCSVKKAVTCLMQGAVTCTVYNTRAVIHTVSVQGQQLAQCPIQGQ